MQIRNLIFSIFLSSFLISSCASFASNSFPSQGDRLRLLRRTRRMKETANPSFSRVNFSEMGDDDSALWSSKEDHRILTLPGQQQKVDFKQYGGYVTIDERRSKALYYYFAEAKGKNHHKKPLVLWLNGGPGCSSLGFGAFGEVGPFRVNSDGLTLYENNYSWNNVANLLFLESPVGVGFSYSNVTSDYKENGDTSTTNQNFIFLLEWLKRFREYNGREFFIAGESYAGHYVSQLAYTILIHNDHMNNTIVNLKGIMIGNAVINEETDTRGMYDYLWTHALISDENHQNLMDYCNFSLPDSKQTLPCQNAEDEAYNVTENIDIYNIYGSLCLSSNLTHKPKAVDIMNPDPCQFVYIHAYLNRPEVQKAMHANVTGLPYAWEACSDVIINWKDSAPTVLDLLNNLSDHGIRTLVYSGDVDSRVPVTSTKYSLNVLNRKKKCDWKAWFLSKYEVAGFWEEYLGDLIFATVRGAGHEVPTYQPARALSLFKHFLLEDPLPSSNHVQYSTGYPF